MSADVRLRREDAGVYLVEVGGRVVGEVVAVRFASHVRRGRFQVSPWWRATRYSDGRAVTAPDVNAPTWDPDRRVDAWPTRRAAVAALMLEAQEEPR